MLKRRAKGLSGHAAKRGRKRAAADAHAGAAAAAPQAATPQVKVEQTPSVVEQLVPQAPSMASSVRRNLPCGPGHRKVAELNSDQALRRRLKVKYAAFCW